MKISTLIYTMLIISIVSISLFYLEEENNKINYEINNISANISVPVFDYSQDIKDKTEKLENSLSSLTDPEKSFFSKLGAGIMAIPYALIMLPSVILETGQNFYEIIISLGENIGIPESIIRVILIFISVVIIFKLIEIIGKVNI